MRQTLKRSGRSSSALKTFNSTLFRQHPVPTTPLSHNTPFPQYPVPTTPRSHDTPFPQHPIPTTPRSRLDLFPRRLPMLVPFSQNTVSMAGAWTFVYLMGKWYHDRTKGPAVGSNEFGGNKKHYLATTSDTGSKRLNVTFTFKHQMKCIAHIGEENVGYARKDA
ncbi:hypothetical protein Q7P36_002161 [Cladosporium allicinum]